MDQLLNTENEISSNLVNLLSARLATTKAALEAVKKENDVLRTAVETLRENSGMMNSAEDFHITSLHTECTTVACKVPGEVARLHSRIADLEHELHVQKDQEDRHVELIAELRSRITLLEDHHRTSERELDELRANADRPSVSVDSLFEGLPSPQEMVPPRADWVPCLPKKCEDPMAEMTEDTLAICRSEGPMMFTHRTRWVSPESDHAIIYSPRYLYDADSEGSHWSRHEELLSFVGSTRELFYRSQGRRILYGGTFKCLQVHELTVGDYKVLPNYMKEELVRLTIKSDLEPRSKDTVRKEYLKGVAKVECLVLQCIGFNQSLYDALLAARLKPSNKRRRDTGGNEERRLVGKKRKIAAMETEVDEFHDDVTLGSDAESSLFRF